MQAIVAPHLGVRTRCAPITDDPGANVPARCPQGIRAHLEVLKAEAFSRAVLQAKSAPGLWLLPKR